METKQLASRGQLYWDAQDSHSPGWWLRYECPEAGELGTAIDGDRDASFSDLADAVALELAGYIGTVAIYSGDRVSAQITIAADSAVSWRCE